MRILLVLGLISIPIGLTIGQHPEHEWIEGFAICVAVALVVNVTALNDYQKEKKFRELQDSYNSSDTVQLIRNGKQKSLQINDILVGDIVQLTTGLVLPCDGVLIRSDNLEMDESAMTGENDSIHKASVSACVEELEQYRHRKAKQSKQAKTATSHHDVRSPVVLSGTTVQSGSGMIVVIAVG